MEDALCWMTIHKDTAESNTLNQKQCQGGGFEETFVPVCATAGRWNNKQEGAAAAAHINKCRHLAGALRNFRDQNDFKYVITASFTTECR